MYDALFPVLYPSMISEFHLTYGLVGMLAMSYRLSSGALQLIMGFLGRFVKRKFLLGLGMIWQCAANSLTAVSQTFDQVLISRTMAGIGSSPQHPTGASYISENFSKERLGGALGINMAAAQVGFFLAPFAGSLLLASFGWRTTIMVFSAPGLLVGIAFLFIHESSRFQERSHASSFAQLSEGLHQVLSNRVVLGVLVLQTVMTFRTGAQSFLPSYFVNVLNMTSVQSGLIFALFMGSGIPAPYLLGHLSDRFGRKKVVVFSMSIAAILWYLLSYPRYTFPLISILVPLGLVNQGVAGVVQAFVADSTTHENRDLIYGIYFTISFALGSLSPVILGGVVDAYGFQSYFIWIALVSTLAVICAACLLKTA
jgi:FSR family fosmidomycin resistance protein-like MFS transporter